MADVKGRPRRKRARSPSKTKEATLNLAPTPAVSFTADEVGAMSREELNEAHDRLCSKQPPECFGTYSPHVFRLHVAKLATKPFTARR